MKYTVSAPVNDQKEVASRMGRMTLSGISAKLALTDARFKAWCFRTKREAEKFAKGLPGAVITAK